MADRSAIEWTDATWNPVTGCTKISPGCAHCYAARFAERFRGVANHPFEHGFDLVLRPERLEQPLAWRRPRRVFVNSMSDLFHRDVPDSFIGAVFETMERATWHCFQILTKRSARMARFLRTRYGSSGAPRHIWCGVSIEDRARLFRLQHLQQSPVPIRFVSLEPLLENLGPIDLAGIAWVIVGGESGPGARPSDPAWVRSIRDQCVRRRVAFFFKQWGGRTPTAGGRELDGRTWDEFPSSALRFPAE